MQSNHYNTEKSSNYTLGTFVYNTARHGLRNAMKKDAQATWDRWTRDRHTPLTFVRDAQEQGLTYALKRDAAQTVDDLVVEPLEQAGKTLLFAAVATICVPYAAYVLSRSNIREKRRMLARAQREREEDKLRLAQERASRRSAPELPQ